MKNILSILTIFLFVMGCNNPKKKIEKKEKIEIETVAVKTEKQTEIEKVSLMERINGLSTGCLDLPMDSIFGKRIQSEKIVDRDAEKWLFGLEKNDSSQFERADWLRPICKLNENNNILSVVFNDEYDYKSAVHIFNFRKSDFKPISSFILYSVGGDAEDFWNIEYEILDDWTYEITETNGRYNDIESRDTTFINLRKTKNIRIDKFTGAIIIEKIKTERNLIITE